MILIADSGSSKTDWVLLSSQGQTETFETPGINPFFQESREVKALLVNTFPSQTRASVKQIFFYGAGCIKGKTDKVVIDALQQAFQGPAIEVADDMLGAARALLGNREGIACILGTGTNSCYYDGHGIVDKVPPLGFILGDEGSGAYMGKMLLNSYFKRAFPAGLEEKIRSELKLELSEALNHIYREEYPSRYLASFSHFIAENQKHPAIANLIKRSLTDFFEKNIEHYANHNSQEISFVGSIAYYYRNFIEEIARKKLLVIGKILPKPIGGLKEYHIKNL
ncbi:MAG: ATPase [Chlorobi bacterium]|nr:ATPase [Chlorobiota bacterium]